MADLGDDLTGLRVALHRNGYRPVPVSGAHLAVKSAGKRPMMKAWETICAGADEIEITRWTRAQRNCTNTGLLWGDLVGVDIDVLDEDHAHRLTCIATEMLSMTPAARIGRAPKILLALRAAAPFNKVQTSEFHMHDGTVARVEVLATGQQFVGFGIHPDTKAPYRWPECSPLDVPLQELPVVERDRCAVFIAAAEDYLRKAGGETTAEQREIEREGRRAAGLKRQEAPTRELIERAVAHIPNDNLSYDEWIKVGHALYAAPRQPTRTHGRRGPGSVGELVGAGGEERRRQHGREMGQFRRCAQHHRRHAVLARAAERLEGRAAPARARGAADVRGNRPGRIHRGRPPAD